MRLAVSLFEHKLPLIEGAIALVAIQAICTLRTGSLSFLGLGALVCLISGLRLIHMAAFMSAKVTHRSADRRGPEEWAREFTFGAAASAALWGITDFWIVLGFDDLALQFLVLLVQSGWLGAATMRNSVSPAIVYWQTILADLSCLTALILSPRSFVQVIIPFLIAHMLIVLNSGRSLGRMNVKLMESEQRLQAINQQLQVLSATDGLTGIANRRSLDAQFNLVWAMSRRDNSDVALLMIDVDYFKMYNDYYGHLAGDDCLRAVATCVVASLDRSSDLAARYGGEEFAALLPGVTEADASKVAERVRQEVMSAALPHATSPFGRVTVSIGVASIVPCPGDDQAALVAVADRALYEAKKAGRNQVRCAPERLILSPLQIQP